MKVLGIVGTARKSGNVSRLCKMILSGAEKSGHSVELVNLYDYNINFCVGCRTCSENGKGKCFQNDDFENIINKVRDADTIVIASPVYWGNVSAIMKNFFDRHMSVEYIFPEGDKYQKLPFGEKLKTFIKEVGRIHIREGITNKKFIIVTALGGLSIIDFFRGQISLYMKSMKQYVKGINGRVIKKFVYTDTLFKFFPQKETKLFKRAFEYGKHLST